MRINGLTPTNPRCIIASNGLIRGKISPQTQIITQSTGCIFPSGYRNKEVAPVQLAEDENRYDRKRGVFTFTRTTITRRKGRAEMNFCFTKPTSPLLAGFNKYQLAYLSHTKQINQYCDNAVHDTSRNTLGKYYLYIKIPRDRGTANATSVIVQWHGRPRRLVYKDALGSIKKLDDPLKAISSSASLKKAKDAYDAVKRANGKFNQGGYPPLSVSIARNKLVVLARYDNRTYNEKKIKCRIKKHSHPVGTTKICLNNTNGLLNATIIYREPLTDWIDKWTNLQVFVNWKPLETISHVIVYKNFTNVKEWSGLVGRNDKYGPYMKFGLYSQRSSKNFKVMAGNALSIVKN